MTCLNFFVLCRKAVLLTYSTFLRMDILEIELLCKNSDADIVLSFAELHATRSGLLHEFSSRPSHLKVVLRWVFFKKSFRFYKFFELVLQFFACTARPCKFRRQGCRRLQDQQIVRVPFWANCDSLMELGWSSISATCSRIPEARSNCWTSHEPMMLWVLLLALVEE